MVAPLDRLTGQNSESLSLPTGAGIVIDLGTGDGRFVYQSARENPRKFFIGIDASPQPLRKISEKIHRNPARGGAPNVIFLQAAVEDLPAELNAVADEVHVHFPWGSLLRAVAVGDELVLRNLRRICSEGAWLEVIIGLDPDKDQTEIARLGLPEISDQYLVRDLIPKYQAAGFDILEHGVLPAAQWREIKSSWARRLSSSRARVLIYLVARAL